MARYTELSEIEAIILMHLKCKVSSLLLILLEFGMNNNHLSRYLKV